MKNLPIILLSGLLVILFSCTNKNSQHSKREISFESEKQELTIPKNGKKRPSITFIMGEDSKLENPFYAEAKKYFKYNPDAQSQFLVDSIYNLREVLEYLKEKHPLNEPAWGTINIVAHSNQWTGISAALIEDGPRITNENLDYALQHEIITSLPDSIIDSDTEVNFHSCGLGQNQEILDLLSIAFGGEDQNRPLVRSSKHFIFYESKTYQNQPYDLQQYMIKTWHTYFKTGYRPGNLKLAAQLREAYPEVGINWLEALEKDKASTAGETFHHTFRIPVVWTVTYENKSARPSVKTETDKELWLSEQIELQEKIKELGIPKQFLNWTIYPTKYISEEGEEPAIKAVGFCTILNVMQAITTTTAEGLTVPAILNMDDFNHFGLSSRGISVKDDIVSQ